MSTSPRDRLLGQLFQLVAPLTASTDAELLGQFVARRDEGAFELLVRRHGPLVFGVCRRVLRNEADAEDAFQATFLVLARKAASVANRGALANWLYGVAYRTALKARALVRKRQAREAHVPLRQPSAPAADTWSDVEGVVDQELAHLPERYRQLVVLCDLQGLARKDAAARVGISEGTLSGQLFRARRLLAERLRGRGLSLSAAALAGLLASAAQASPPAAAVLAVVQAAGAFANGLPVAGGAVSSAALALTSGVLKTMLARKLLTGMLAVVLIAAVGLGWASYTAVAAPIPAGTGEANKAADQPKAGEVGPVNIQLLHHRKVVQELKCSNEQWDKIDDALEKANLKVREAIQAVFVAGRGGPPPRPGGGADDGVKKVWAEASKEITGKILRPAQVKRLQEIDLQASGANAFQAPRVVKALNLTDKQQTQVKDLIAGMEKAVQDKIQATMRAPGGGVISFDSTDLQPNHAPALKAIQAGLTAEQKKVWKGLVGQPVKFDLKKMMGGHKQGFTMGGVVTVEGKAVPLPGAGGGAPPPRPRQ